MISRHFIRLLYANVKQISQVDFAVSMNYSKKDLQVTGSEQDAIKEQIQEDFVKADIYFKSLNVHTIAQEKKFTVSKLKNYAYDTVPMPVYS